MDEIPAAEFDSHSFDARDFVQRYRKRLPLPQLQRGLRLHHASTRQEVVELINEKYVDFVSLSSRMQGVERALKPLRAPLEESVELTRGLRSRLGALLEQAERTHGLLAEVRARRDSLTAYIENARLLNKARASVSQRWGDAQEADDFLREHVAQENVAWDLRRVHLNLGGTTQASSTGGGRLVQEEVSPECRALLGEAAEFEEAFAKRLCERLQGLIRSVKHAWSSQSQAQAQAQAQANAAPGHSQKGVLSLATTSLPRMELLAIAHLSRALVTTGRVGVVEDAFAEVFASSALEAAAVACAGAAEEAQRRSPELGGGSAAVAGAVHLGPFFDSVLASLLTEDAPLVWLAQRLCTTTEGSSPHATTAENDDCRLEDSLLAVPCLCLISNAAVGPVLRYVQQVWPNVFMPAFPDVFAANYTRAASFVRAAEAFMAPSERQAFSRSAVLTDFKRRWKTQVYSSLRNKEAIQRFEVAAAKSRTAAEGAAFSLGPPHVVAHRGFWLEASAEVIRILDLVWSEGWSLDVLFPKTLQLSLEIVNRYCRLVRFLASPEGTGADVAAAAGWDAAAVPPTWTPSSQLVRLLHTAADVLAMISEVGSAHDATAANAECVVDSILKRLPVGHTGSDVGRRPASAIVQALLQDASDGLQPVLQELEEAMLRHVSALTSAQFAAIRGIPAFYRMLNKPVPTKASPYVESALRPIKALQEVAAPVVPAAAVVGWIRRAVEGAAAEFSVQAAQLLESTHQQEASLRRLAGRPSSSDAQVSDLEKIHIQLRLDVETFSAASLQLGATSAAGSALSKLSEVCSQRSVSGGGEGAASFS